MLRKSFFIAAAFVLCVCSLHAQDGVTCIEKISTSNNCYRLTKAEKTPRGMVVLLPYYGADANEFNSARLPQLLAKQGITTVVVSAAGYLFDDDLESLHGLLSAVAQAHQIPPGKVIMGGISAGGTGAARFVERCQMQDCGAIKPVAWFSVDAPLDFERWWNSQVINLQRGDPKSHLEETQAILDVLKMSMGGSPKEARDTYIKKSPFLAWEKGGGNAQLLAKIPVRLYTEPDVIWTIENWRTDYYNSNAVDQAALTLQLLELGNTRAELITTTGKGYRPRAFATHTRGRSWTKTTSPTGLSGSCELAVPLTDNWPLATTMPDHFFFYGTLIPQYAPDHLREVLAGLFFLGEGSSPGTLYDFGNYPGAVFDEASPSRVFGRVYWGSCDDLLLAELDRYEGYDQLSPAEGEYIRRRRSVTLDNGDVVECWTYDYNWSTEGFAIIANGRWEG